MYVRMYIYIIINYLKKSNLLKIMSLLQIKEVDPKRIWLDYQMVTSLGCMFSFFSCNEVAYG